MIFNVRSSQILQETVKTFKNLLRIIRRKPKKFYIILFRDNNDNNNKGCSTKDA